MELLFVQTMMTGNPFNYHATPRNIWWLTLWTFSPRDNNVFKVNPISTSSCMNPAGRKQFAAELMLSSCTPFDSPELCPLLMESGELDSTYELQTSSTSTPSQWFCRLWERRLMLNRKMGGSISTALRSSTSPPTSHGGQKSCVAFQDSAPTGSLRGPFQPIHEIPGWIELNGHAWECTPQARASPTNGLRGLSAKSAVWGWNMFQNKGAQQPMWRLAIPSWFAKLFKIYRRCFQATWFPTRPWWKHATTRWPQRSVWRLSCWTTRINWPNYRRRWRRWNREWHRQRVVPLLPSWQVTKLQCLRLQGVQPLHGPRSHPPHSPELNEMFELMTEDEKQELTNRLRQRRESIPVSDTEINPPYQQWAATTWLPRRSTWTSRTSILYLFESVKSMVNTLHLVNNEFNEIMAETVYGKKPLVWELFCGPQSQLTTSCLENGLETMRINLASGFDLYKDETWDKLYGLYDRHRPEKLWFSPRCTYFCD